MSNGSTGRFNPLPVLLVVILVFGVAVSDGVAAPTFGPRVSQVLRPPMGWDSWNTFGCAIDETKIVAVARAMVSSGMRAAGYRYVVVDDCWQAPTRAADGSLVADPTRFPHGMAALGAQIHALGLEFGIYQSPGAQTCAEYSGTVPGATGAAGHEQQDARTFASWGVDYLKYDWCSSDGTVTDQAIAFARMDRALRATGRPIVYSINPNSAHADTGPLYDWGQVADLWRTTPHLAMWAMMAADIVALDQDPLGRQSHRIRGDEHTQIWARPLADGSVAVALLNRSSTATVMTTSAAELTAPAAEMYAAHDLWAKTTTVTRGPLSTQVAPHAAVLYRIRPGS